MPSGSPRPGPIPGTPSPVPGLGDGPADRDMLRDHGLSGLIDPDEPTDGIRLMQ
jgi:hypothetical protein